MHSFQAKWTSQYASFLSKPIEEEVLLLYLEESDHAVSTILVREEGNRQYNVYYVSKFLLHVEPQYNHLDKLSLVLVIAAFTSGSSNNGGKITAHQSDTT